MVSKKMGMFLQDPALPDLMEDYDFDLDDDYHEGMGSRRFVVRDQDAALNPVNAALDWATFDDLSASWFNGSTGIPVDERTAVKGELPVGGGPFPLPRLTENPHFRQVNLFAGANYVLDWMEEEIGTIGWGWFPLVLRPHALEQDIAYFDPVDFSLNFGYFRSPHFPHRQNYTCLNLDTIAHELGHAVLRNIRPNFNWSHLDHHALDEAFGDVCALFTALGNARVVTRFVEQTGGDLRLPSIVSRLYERDAPRFSYMASFLSERQLYHETQPEVPALRSQIWGQAIYEILIRFTEDAASRAPKATFADHLSEAVHWLRGMLLRTLHYLPPTGVTMPLWARIIDEADSLVYGTDDRLRTIARTVFRERRIWDDAIQVTPPAEAVGQALQDHHKLHMTVMANAEALGIPRGQGIVLAEPWVQDVTRKVDKVNGQTREITERYLQLRFQYPDGYAGSATLVLSEDWKPLVLAHAPKVKLSLIEA